MIAHSRFNVIHLPSIGQMVKFMMIAAGPANRAASPPNFCFSIIQAMPVPSYWEKKGRRLTIEK
jgi:hypothetical protein